MLGRIGEIGGKHAPTLGNKVPLGEGEAGFEGLIREGGLAVGLGFHADRQPMRHVLQPRAGRQQSAAGGHPAQRTGRRLAAGVAHLETVGLGFFGGAKHHGGTQRVRQLLDDIFAAAETVERAPAALPTLQGDVEGADDDGHDRHEHRQRDQNLHERKGVRAATRRRNNTSMACWMGCWHWLVPV